ncbi:MAG TPA: choice-of-anchor D domain-containing protein [Ignavibacteriaceae bacterium]|nr:choice-of-anchor D domain-containing protein [Ignavibacteriaceae bacterium]
MKKVLILIVLLISILSFELFAARIDVPINFPTIQSAINASTSGDTIIVHPGTYFENINFKGKNIVVASLYLITNDRNYIRQTVIDGSQPSNPDSASCVLIISGENSSAILDGFTLTGGTGTNWVDEHGAGVYREGGGILIALSSPTIRNNYIIYNTAIKNAQTVSSGGGGIRAGDGSPKIISNIIINNKGMYGGGIVLNYCSGALVSNNIISNNMVYQAVAGAATYGGGGIWVNNKLNGTPNSIINNTIVNNSAFGENTSQGAGKGGGVLFFSGSNVLMYNNIVWNNKQVQNQFFALSSTYTAEYNNMQESITGTGNISSYPMFSDSSFILELSSPCIDAGNPGINYNDKSESGNPQNAAFPSRGTLRNDIGAYGGPGALTMLNLAEPVIGYITPIDFGLFLPGDNIMVVVRIPNNGSGLLLIDSVVIPSSLAGQVSFSGSLPLDIKPATDNSFSLTWSPTTNMIFNDSIAIYSNDTTNSNPTYFRIKGNSIPTPLINFNREQINLGDININTVRIDTSFYLKNIGTGRDSLSITVDPKGINPPSAISVSPMNLTISAKDSQKVTLTIFPSQIIKSVTGIYSPIVKIHSSFSLDSTDFQKPFRFRLTGTLTDVNEDNSIPNDFALYQNYPNPFNPTTTINYDLPAFAQINISIYNSLGEKVKEIKSGYQEAGKHSVIFNANELSSGVYFYKLSAGEFNSVRKMILQK